MRLRISRRHGRQGRRGRKQRIKTELSLAFCGWKANVSRWRVSRSGTRYPANVYGTARALPARNSWLINYAGLDGSRRIDVFQLYPRRGVN
jgi:hypothetical protein